MRSANARLLSLSLVVLLGLGCESSSCPDLDGGSHVDAALDAGPDAGESDGGGSDGGGSDGGGNDGGTLDGSSPSDAGSDGGSELPPLPSGGVDVTTRGLTGDGVTDDSAACNALMADTSVTALYFPTGTYLLNDCQIQSHVKLIYGEADGSSEIVPSMTTSWVRGLWFSSYDTDSVVIDSLSFRYNENTSLIPIAASGSHIAIWGDSGSHTNITIRRCHFYGHVRAGMNGSGWKGDNAIKFWMGPTSTHSIDNVTIEYCSFHDINRGSVEIVNRVGNGGIDRVTTHHCTFENTGVSDSFWRMAYSHSRYHGSSSQVYDNTFDGFEMVLEADGRSRNIDFHHNLVTNTINRVVVETDENDDVYQMIPNWYHHNHFGSQTGIFLIHASNSLFEDNYIENTFFVSNNSSTADDNTTGDLLTIQNNIFVRDASLVSTYSFTKAIMISSGTVMDVVADGNEIYGINASGSVAKFSDAESSVTNNQSYTDNTSECLSVAGTSSGNTCTQSYTGPYPTVPSDVGPRS